MKREAFLLLLAASWCQAAGSYHLIGWNDLGMHCMDGDYEVYAILPPYNTIHAQLVDANGKLVTNPAGLTVTYEAAADATGSINASSTGKSNFWRFAQALFGIALGAETGLTGNQMPGVANKPQSMKWEAASNWFTADGIPLTPFDDNRNKNYYSMMRLVAKDSAGNVLAKTDIVLPVSDEMDCSSCHASGSNTAARPRAGWANQPLLERDFKYNILRRHDDLQNGTPLYRNALAANGYNPQGLYTTATSDARPVLCAACHASNALSAAGQAGIPPLTTSIHAFHANQNDPSTGTSLDASSNRTACYRCHPGSETRCLRGVMGTSVAADGTLAIQCQSCHGTMSAIGLPGRQGWLEEPTCQSCHSGTAANNSGQIRYTTTLDAQGNPRVAADLTFATQSDVPAAGLSLFRFSKGHGGLACEACHGSTHAEFQSAEANDNVQITALQGHAGIVAECNACHSTVPPSGSGPHGMHQVGSTWVSSHQSAARGGGAQCRSCHGMDFRGTVLSRASASRTLTAFGTLNVWRGFQIGCYTCHNGPSSDNRNSNGAPVVTGGSLSTGSGQVATLPISVTDPNGDAVTLWVVSQPANGTISLNGKIAIYTPRSGFEGTDSFTVAAWDGQTSSNLANFSLQVTAGSRPRITSVLNGASFQGGAVAPGELVSIFGGGLGPATAAGMSVNSAGLVNRSLAGTRVLFDGLPAPVLYSSDGQVNAVVPWGLAGQGSTNLQVEYGGIRSTALPLGIAAASPAIFPSAVVNVQDGSLNSTSAPAGRGTYITFYATGGGTMDVPRFDGEFSNVPLGRTVAAVAVKIGGVDAQVSYAGESPGLVSGALQVNVQVPASAPIGNAVPMVLQIGGVPAQAASIAVK